jgi:hypothetical protein
VVHRLRCTGVTALEITCSASRGGPGVVLDEDRRLVHAVRRSRCDRYTGTLDVCDLSLSGMIG